MERLGSILTREFSRFRGRDEELLRRHRMYQHLVDRLVGCVLFALDVMGLGEHAHDGLGIRCSKLLALFVVSDDQLGPMQEEQIDAVVMVAIRLKSCNHVGVFKTNRKFCLKSSYKAAGW